MRPHKINIAPRSITLDGIPLLHGYEAPTIKTVAPGLHRIRLTIYAHSIQLEGDDHRALEPTPIYDQLKEEL